jgi:hypothetical protein
MADRRPPRQVTDAPGTLTALLAYRRTWLPGKVDARTEERAGWSQVPSGASVCWPIGHMAGDADPPVNPQRILAHLEEESARHAGHVDILRGLLAGATGR